MTYLIGSVAGNYNEWECIDIDICKEYKAIEADAIETSVVFFGIKTVHYLGKENRIISNSDNRYLDLDS